MNQQHPCGITRAPITASPRFAPTLLTRSLQAAFAVIAATAVVGVARANPQGGVVVGGQATISQLSPALTTIQQSSQRAVIDWRSFSIGASEAVRFNQPGPTAATLNRVTGNEPSNIMGSLSANGRVYLVNQNGVFIGPNAQLDAAALVLSTANISNSDFMAGNLKFDQPGKPGAKIINEGRITAADGGLVAMVAPGVENRGVISARLGQVVLGGAPAFSLDLFGDGMVNIVLSPNGMGAISDATGRPLTNYVDNSGKVTADGGRIWISAATARGLVDGMVNISGDLRATRVAQQGGEITLLGGNSLTVNGNVAATSVDGKGGSIAASADAITLASNAVLDASGATGGGTVLVGGGYQGKSAVAGADSTARRLEVAAGTRVQADTTGAQGNGGQVVLWSEDATRFAGQVSARAGRAGGDGGLMEVSGKKQLAFEGTADASAPLGQAGTLLLDPGSLTVAATGSGGFTASGADSVVGAGTINSVLRTGTSVALRADDNIDVNAQIDGRAVPGGPAGATGGGLSLTAGGAVTVEAPIVLNDGAFSVAGGSFTQVENGIIATLGSKPISITTGGNIASQYLLTSGALSLTSVNGNITAGRSLGIRFEDGTAQPLGSLSLSAANGSANLAGGLYVNGNATLDARNLQLGATITTGLLQVAGGGNFTLLGNAQVGGFHAGTATAPLASFSMAGPADSKLPQIDAGGQGVSVVAASIGTLRGIRSAAGIGLDARGGDLTLARLESTRGGLVDVRSAGSIDLPLNTDIVNYGGTVALRAGAGHVEAVGTIAVNDAAAPGAAAPGTIVLSAGGDIGVRQLVGMGNTSITSTNGNVWLNETLGGDVENRPVLGSLFVNAGKDVTTNGLNLAGATDGYGLRLEAGTAGGGGYIYVNDRIGVSRGHLQFGTDAVTSDANRSAVLYQGVYARTGHQNIIFNVPLVADGSKIAGHWRDLLVGGQTQDKRDLLNDMILIPVTVEGNNGDLIRNPAADALVARGGGLRVVFDPALGTNGKVTRVREAGEAVTDGDYWMIPKVVVSNQEVRSVDDKGFIALRGGLPQLPDNLGNTQATAAIKFIVPMPAGERDVVESNFSQTFVREFENELASISQGNPALNVARLQVAQTLQVNLHPDSGPLPVYLGILPTVVEYAPVNRYLPDGQGFPTTPVSVSVAVFGGPMGVTTQLDGTHILPSGERGFNSNSTPIGFLTPFSSSGDGLGLSAQVLAALPPPSTAAAPPPSAGGNNGNAGGNRSYGGSGELLAATSTIESRAEQQPEAICPGSERQVIGRSAGDEADVGATPALQGAPRPVFTTTYALGEARGLPNADNASIAGRPRGVACL